MKQGICEATGRYGTVEDAHFVHGGIGRVKGCTCPPNMIRLLKRIHRFTMHGYRGGWSRVLTDFPSLWPRYEAALKHYAARCRGEGCGAKTKTGQLAAARVARATEVHNVKSAV